METTEGWRWRTFHIWWLGPLGFEKSGQPTTAAALPEWKCQTTSIGPPMIATRRELVVAPLPHSNSAAHEKQGTGAEPELCQLGQFFFFNLMGQTQICLGNGVPEGGVKSECFQLSSLLDLMNQSQAYGDKYCNSKIRNGPYLILNQMQLTSSFSFTLPD